MHSQVRQQTEDSPSSPESDNAKGSSKKRPSRAGTRSVSTLSAVQLERKRANDREAQRAIRQRTREHIEGLERRIRELTAAAAGTPDGMLTLLNRNKELEKENSYLRLRLHQAGISPVILPSDHDNSPDQSHVQSMQAPPGFAPQGGGGDIVQGPQQHGYQTASHWPPGQSSYMPGSSQPMKKDQHHISPIEDLSSPSVSQHWAMSPSSLGSPGHESVSTAGGTAAAVAALSFPSRLIESTQRSNTPNMGGHLAHFDTSSHRHHRFSHHDVQYPMQLQQAATAAHYPQHHATPMLQSQHASTVHATMHDPEPEAHQPMYGHYQNHPE